MRIQRKTRKGTVYQASFRRRPTKEAVQALDALADAAAKESRLTPRQRVLRKYPKAISVFKAHPTSPLWAIITNDDRSTIIGAAKNATAAWAQADRNIKSIFLTPRQRVLEKYPEAVAWPWADCVEIYTKRYNTPPGGNRAIGRGQNARQAWAAAARKL